MMRTGTMRRRHALIASVALLLAISIPSISEPAHAADLTGEWCVSSGTTALRNQPSKAGAARVWLKGGDCGMFPLKPARRSKGWILVRYGSRNLWVVESLISPAAHGDDVEEFTVEQFMDDAAMWASWAIRYGVAVAGVEDSLTKFGANACYLYATGAYDADRISIKMDLAGMEYTSTATKHLLVACGLI